MPHAQQLYMRYAKQDLTADQPGGPGCAMREWPLELETVQSRSGTLMDDRFVTMRWCWHGMAENKQKKAKKWSQRYKTEYSLHYPCIRKSERGNFHAFCTICSGHFSWAWSWRSWWYSEACWEQTAHGHREGEIFEQQYPVELFHQARDEYICI